MTFTTLENDIEYFSFQTPEFSGTVHGFFTRKGGVSEGKFQSLNLGGSIGDSPENVIENRRRVFAAVERDPKSLFDVWQVHGTEVTFADRPRNLAIPPMKSDAIFTNNPAVTLLMRFADCVPIIIYDRVKQVVGIVHAGWMGTVNQIADKAISEVRNRYGSAPGDIVAAIGPSIGPDHYFVGVDVYNQARAAFKDDQSGILTKENGKFVLNLWKANEHLLRKAGVQDIKQASICTACDTKRWFSHRAESGQTGRFAAVIGLVV